MDLVVFFCELIWLFVILFIDIDFEKGFVLGIYVCIVRVFEIGKLLLWGNLGVLVFFSFLFLEYRGLW